jgi:hypothetical protein
LLPVWGEPVSAEQETIVGESILVEHTFADGVSSIAVVGETARLNFFVFVPAEKTGGPQTVAHHQVVMPLSSFLQATAKFREAADAINQMKSGALSSAGQSTSHVESANPSVAAFPAKNTRPPFP